MPTIDERRHFLRVLFDRPANLTQGPISWTSKIIDLSLKGALVASPANWDDTVGEVELSFDLTEIPDQQENTHIKMLMRVCHNEANVLGLECLQLDIESASHLKRLIELNLGDESLLHRQLEHLVAP
jgi:hypothetical protein